MTEEVNNTSSKDKIFKESSPVFEYFGLTEETWEILVGETYSSLLEVAYLRDIQDKIDIFSMKMEDLIKMISEDVDKFRNKQISIHLLQFLNLSREKQESVIHDINCSKGISMTHVLCQAVTPNLKPFKP